MTVVTNNIHQWYFLSDARSVMWKSVATYETNSDSSFETHKQICCKTVNLIMWVLFAAFDIN